MRTRISKISLLIRRKYTSQSNYNQWWAVFSRIYFTMIQSRLDGFEAKVIHMRLYQSSNHVLSAEPRRLERRFPIFWVAFHIKPQLKRRRKCVNLRSLVGGILGSSSRTCICRDCGSTFVSTVSVALIALLPP